MRDTLLETGHCLKCGDARYRKTAHGWTPCVCLSRLQRRDLANQIAIPLLKGKDPYLAECWHECEPWSVESDHFEWGGDWETFRHKAWRSIFAVHEVRLTQTRNDPFRVEVLPTWRLQEIAFQRDPEGKYVSVLDLQRPELIILIEGTEPYRHQVYIRDLAESLLSLRRLHGKATWVYTPTHLPVFKVDGRTVLTQASPDQQQDLRENKSLPPVQPESETLASTSGPIERDLTGRVRRVH